MSGGDEDAEEDEAKKVQLQEVLQALLLPRLATLTAS